MDFRTAQSAISMASVMALLMAFLALWATVAIAGLNEDLVEASRRGDLSEVKRLLTKGADINFKDEKSYFTPLMEASRIGHTELVKVLLAKGAKVNAKTLGGETALMWASFKGHRKVVQLLLAKGADVNAKNSRDETALIPASLGGHQEVVEVLLANGAKVNAKDKRGKTALIIASVRGYPELVRVLLARCAEVNVRDESGNTALDYVKSREIEEILIKAGARRKADTPKFRFVDWWKAYASKLPSKMVVASLIILLVGGLWLGKTWQARGPEPDVGPQPNYLSSPPSDLPPAMVLLLRNSRLDEGDNVQLIMATLIDLARKGVFFLKVEQEPIWYGGNKTEVYIGKREKKAKFQFETLLATTLAGLTLPYHQNTVISLLPQFKESLERESVATGLFEESPTKVQMRVRKPGLVILHTAYLALPLVLLLFLFSIMEPQNLFIILPVLTLGIVGALAAYLVAPGMPKRTWQGVREAALWSAFENHLREIPWQRELAQTYLDQWDSYLPYSIIFGFQIDWLNRFMEMRAPAPSWFHAPENKRPATDSGEVPLTVDNVREAFYGMFSTIYNTVDFELLMR